MMSLRSCVRFPLHCNLTRERGLTPIPRLRVGLVQQDSTRPPLKWSQPSSTNAGNTRPAGPVEADGSIATRAGPLQVDFDNRHSMMGRCVDEAGRGVDDRAGADHQHAITPLDSRAVGPDIVGQHFENQTMSGRSNPPRNPCAGRGKVGNGSKAWSSTTPQREHSAREPGCRATPAHTGRPPPVQAIHVLRHEGKPVAPQRSSRTARGNRCAGLGLTWHSPAWRLL